MTRFEWFQCCGAEGVEHGAVGADVYAMYIRYLVYLDFKSQGNDNATSITLTAERNNCSDRTIYRAIEYFDELMSK